jgi:hypothetical protein
LTKRCNPDAYPDDADPDGILECPFIEAENAMVRGRFRVMPELVDLLASRMRDKLDSFHAFGIMRDRQIEVVNKALEIRGNTPRAAWPECMRRKDEEDERFEKQLHEQVCRELGLDPDCMGMADDDEDGD